MEKNKNGLTFGRATYGQVNKEIVHGVIQIPDIIGNVLAAGNKPIRGEEVWPTLGTLPRQGGLPLIEKVRIYTNWLNRAGIKQQIVELKKRK